MGQQLVCLRMEGRPLALVPEAPAGWMGEQGTDRWQRQLPKALRERMQLTACPQASLEAGAWDRGSNGCCWGPWEPASPGSFLS